jgi:DNA-binding transcriptional ArsR family regulator
MTNAGQGRSIRTVTDPTTLRALAHPLRLSLLDLFDREGELTATRAAELTGESSANCSFHLRQLAKHGFIEQAEGRNGRERPWRRATAGARVPVTADPRLLDASAAVTRLVVEQLAAEVHDFLHERGVEEVEWQDAILLTSETFHLTLDELRNLSRDVAAAIERRAGAQTKREGTRPVRVAATLFPLSPLA